MFLTMLVGSTSSVLYCMVQKLGCKFEIIVFCRVFQYDEPLLTVTLAVAGVPAGAARLKASMLFWRVINAEPL